MCVCVCGVCGHILSVCLSCVHVCVCERVYECVCVVCCMVRVCMCMSSVRITVCNIVHL